MQVPRGGGLRKVECKVVYKGSEAARQSLEACEVTSQASSGPTDTCIVIVKLIDSTKYSNASLVCTLYLGIK